ncbi:hypothetical protein HFA01_19740 [Halobacillus faecis]|uniref:Uncharacterized protein n=1 Tax=Halobacillus faecis TaxID=360184 RepID=A0A511WWE8_9BACI|nr:hypothetical protein HFA01_19740 [Halobacillus faecis]
MSFLCFLVPDERFFWEISTKTNTIRPLVNAYKVDTTDFGTIGKW